MMPERQPADAAAPRNRPVLDHVPAEDMAAVLQLATELYARDQALSEDALQRGAALAAADELGVPAAYMERAAAEVHARRIEDVLRRRRNRRLVLGALGASAVGALGLWGGWRLTHRPSPPAIVYTFDANPENRWRLNLNPESSASLAFESRPDGGGAAAIRVERFGPDAGGAFFVNLDSTNGPQDLGRYERVSFSTRGAGLPQLRLYLEASATERWRSPPVPVVDGWQEQRLRLDQFERQTRDSASAAWRTAPYRSPGRIERLSFKLGSFVNDVQARGTVMIGGARVE
jgi:hypothetical protein